MRLSKYYSILNLPNGASETDVRKRYRKLAMQFHPDRNPSAEAKQRFIELTDAYEILIGKKQAPPQCTTQSKARRAAHTGNPAPTQEERMKEARQRHYEQIIQEHEENEQYFKQLTKGVKWKTLRISAILGILITAGLLADRFLPSHFEPDRVTHYSLNAGFGGDEELLTAIKTEMDQTYWVSKVNYNLYGRYPSIITEKSWIFHEPIQLISRGKVNDSHFKTHYSFRSNQWIISFVLLLPLFTLLYKRKNVIFTVLFQLSYWGVNAALIWFLLNNDHWLHFLTAGFV